MKNLDEYVSCIGKAEDAPEVQKLLASLGIFTKLKMPQDDIDVRHRLPELGISLIFKPEGPQSSRLICNAVQFISDTEHGYTTFAGDLPAQLQFSDGPVEVHVKLGAPHIAKPKLRLDIWQLQGLRLAINYTKDQPHHISVLTIQLPREG